ncbi:MAG: histidine kinase dimerization/phospho-acceptor domain-containing protein, partial [Sphaerobacter sp.]|nr:histidine kinase dimerization/phospho-acceptor domain-containing protein [Sphaerobacter sp.]
MITPPAVRTAPDLHGLACALFEPLTLDELLAALPRILAVTLTDGLLWRVAVADSDGTLDAPAVAEAGWQVALPLRHDGRLLGALIVAAPGQAACPVGWDQTCAGRVAALVAAALDHHRRAEEAAAPPRDLAAHHRSDVAAILSHEMRTPLASIKGYASALLLNDASWDDATRREFLAAIDAETDHLTQLINDILDTSLIEAGALTIEREPIQIPHVVRRAIDKLAVRSERHRFVLSFPSDFPVVEADERRIDQVLTNLLDNAVKYSPHGGLIVVSGRVAGDEVVISVADQGIGIAPEHLNKLFERFFRARHRTRVAGTG